MISVMLILIVKGLLPYRRIEHSSGLERSD
jgi:hypothetical protein